MKMVLTLIILFTFSNQATAQVNTDSLWRANQEVQIPTSVILGKWQSTDSTKLEISVVEKEGYMTIEGLTAGVSGYMFTISGDSVAVNGFASNWPRGYSEKCVKLRIGKKINLT